VTYGKMGLAAGVALALVAPLGAQAFVFDPDVCVTCPDTRGHALAGVGISVGLQTFTPKLSPLARIGVVFAVGVGYEFGQEAIVRESPAKRGPGYGFGVKDILADVAGALIAEGLGALWRQLK